MMTKPCTLLLALALAASGFPALAADGGRAIAMDLGRSPSNAARGRAELDIYRIGYQWDFNRTLWQGEHADIGGYFEASLNHWDSPFDDVTAAAISPVFRLTFGSALGSYRPYIEAGIGLALLSDDRVGGRGLGSSWQFENRIGLGLASARFDFHYRYMHYSNADIEKPNHGIDAHVIGVGYRF